MKTSLWKSWLRKEKIKIGSDNDSYEWHRSVPKRNYLHIDPKINVPKQLNHIAEQVLSPEIVAKRSFYPFIYYKQETPRYKKQEDGSRKSEIKERPIMYASHFDALVFSWYATKLDAAYELFLEKQNYSDCILAYRKFEEPKSNIHFSKKAFDEIISYNGGCTVICIDISGFFDNLSHKILLASLLSVLGQKTLPQDWQNILGRVTDYAYLEKDDLEKALGLNGSVSKPVDRLCSAKEFRALVAEQKIIKQNPTPGRGIPQGTPISAVLSNVYMQAFDDKVYSYINKVEGKYFRYSDDILLIIPQKIPIEKVLDDIVMLMEDEDVTDLKINVDKTETFKFVPMHGKIEISELKKSNSGKYEVDSASKAKLKYLGLEFDGQNIYLRNSSLSRYQAKMMRAIKRVVKAEVKKGHTNIKTKNLRGKYTAHYSSSPEKLRSFIGYAYRAAKITGSKKIIRQIRNHKKIFNKKLAIELKKLS